MWRWRTRRAFLAEWEASVPGTVVFPTIDRRRPVLVEVQALGSPGEFTPSRRSARGIDPVRLHQLLAVLDRHAGVGFPQKDVYVGVVGGLTLTDPGIDLPVALALVSSLQDVPLGPMAAWGEVGLTGEVRQVPLAARRREGGRAGRRPGVGSVERRASAFPARSRPLVSVSGRGYSPDGSDPATWVSRPALGTCG